MSKVIRLTSENILRLVAVDITPEGHLIMIGGANGAGKSAVLNSLAMALGGKEMVPEEPLREGESEGRVFVDLGDLRVTRRFSREHLPCDCIGSNDSFRELAALPNGFEHDQDCASLTKFGETKSVLSVTNAEETANYRSPQAMLDKLLGKLTFDPLKFKDEDPKKQDEMLRQLVGLDVSQIEIRRVDAFGKRAIYKKQLAAKEAVLEAMPLHKDAPAAEISLDEVSKEMLQAEEYRKIAEDAERMVDKAKDAFNAAERALDITRDELDKTRRQLNALINLEVVNKKSRDETEREVDARQITAQSARAVVPDMNVIREKLSQVEVTNVKVRANKKRQEAAAEIKKMETQIDEQVKLIDGAEEEKRAALAAVKFPVDGLGLSDKGVTFNDLPFSQASTAEQLRVSVAIGLALNPNFRVLLIRSGNLLDEDALKVVAQQAEAADAQVWMEYVTKDAADVQVMIVDGQVAS